MDSGDHKGSDGSESQLRVPVLEDRIAERFELYQTMAQVFFNWIPDEDRIKAMAEVVDAMKGSNSEE